MILLVEFENFNTHYRIMIVIMVTDVNFLTTEENEETYKNFNKH